MRKFPALIAVAVAIPFGLAACGSDDSSSSTTAASTDTTSSTEASTTESTTASGGGGGETVDIGETEYKLDPSDATAKAGTVTFAVTNDGTQVHNLEVEGNGIEEQGTEDLQSGSNGEVTLDLKPGTYEMYCSIDGHRDLGMEGQITVQ
jgi:uncharacterized cupredoxin-like copper-binding protein